MTQGQQTWHKYTDVPLIVASLAYLIAYTWRAIGDLSGVGWTLTLTMTTTWLMFLIDYVVRFAAAKEKVRWFVTHWFDLLCVMVPVLRLVILLRVFTRLGSAQVGIPGDRMRVQVMVYEIGASAILVYISALAVLEAERNARARPSRRSAMRSGGLV